MPLLLPSGAVALGADGALLEPAADGRCAECCGDVPEPPPYCAWCPCDQPGCWKARPIIWIRADVRCTNGDEPIGCTGFDGVILRDGWCYRRSSAHEPTPGDQLPPEAIRITPPSRVTCLSAGGEDPHAGTCQDERCLPEATPEDGECPPCEDPCAKVCWGFLSGAAEDPPQPCAHWCCGGERNELGQPQWDWMYDRLYEYTFIDNSSCDGFVCPRTWYRREREEVLYELPRPTTDCGVCKVIRLTVETGGYVQVGGQCVWQEDTTTLDSLVCLSWGDQMFHPLVPGSFDARGPCPGGCGEGCGLWEEWNVVHNICSGWTISGRGGEISRGGAGCTCDDSVDQWFTETRTLTFVPGPISSSCCEECRAVMCGGAVQPPMTGGQPCEPEALGRMAALAGAMAGREWVEGPGGLAVPDRRIVMPGRDKRVTVRRSGCSGCGGDKRKKVE